MMNSTENTYNKETKKFNYLKFTPKNQSSQKKTKKSEIIDAGKTTNEHCKPSYAAALKRKSNTNLRRKLNKQNIGENELNKSVKKSILNARRSRGTSRNTSTEVPPANLTGNNKNEALQNETEILKKEFKSVRKNNFVVSQIPTRRQL